MIYKEVSIGGKVKVVSKFKKVRNSKDKNVKDKHIGNKLKLKYDLLKERYDLPNLNELMKYFDLRNIDDDNINTLLLSITKRMINRFDDYLSLFSDLLQPDTDTIDLYESDVLSKKDKQLVWFWTKKLMLLKRKHSLLCLELDEEAQALFIKEAFEAWISIVPGLKTLLNKLINAWESNNKRKEDINYFG